MIAPHGIFVKKTITGLRNVESKNLTDFSRCINNVKVWKFATSI